MEEREKDSKKLLIALIILVLLLLAALVWFLFFFKWPKKVEQVKEQPKVEQSVQKQLDVTTEETIATSVKQLEIVADEKAPAADQKDVEKANLEKMASLFAERLGSYSNQSDYGNIVDLKVFMTDSMKEWADGYVEKARAENAYDGIYRGTVTRAISAEVEEFDSDAGSAKAIVHTQRVDSSDNIDNEVVYYEDLSVSFKKEGPSWLVDYAKWQGKKAN